MAEVFNYKYTGDVQEFVVPMHGYYIIECWGSYNKGRGWISSANRACGGYTKGKIELRTNEILYLYIGASGENFNFGTQAYSNNAGGATDVRLIRGSSWNDAASLKSRIMVAAGAGTAGGKNATNTGDVYGGSGGGLTGQKGGNINTGQGGDPGTQTSGYAFGYAGGAAPGGNGYYSGYSGYYNIGVAGGGGGSSFISGHEGCNAISEDGTHTGQPIHYSGRCFIETTMLSGNDYVSHPETGEKVLGYEGDGYIRITYAGPIIGTDYEISSSQINGFKYRFTIEKKSDTETTINDVSVVINNSSTYAQQINENEYEIDLLYCCKDFKTYEAEIQIKYTIEQFEYETTAIENVSIDYNQSSVLLSNNASMEEVHERMVSFKEYLQFIKFQLGELLYNTGGLDDKNYSQYCIGDLIGKLKPHIINIYDVEFTLEDIQKASFYNGTITTITGYENSAGVSITGRPDSDAYSNMSLFLRCEFIIDFTYVDSISFYAKKGADHGRIDAYITPTGFLATSKESHSILKSIEYNYGNAPTTWTKYEINTKDIIGTKVLSLVGGYSDSTGNTTSNTQYSKITLHCSKGAE